MPTVLAVMAHPDDVEITCAGTLVLFKRAGWEVRLATLTAGDLGSPTLPRQEIAGIRRKEAAAAAAVIGASYTCLGFDDLTIVYDAVSKRRVSSLLRATRPDLLIVPSPFDYMADHQETARIVREAAFASTVPHWQALPADDPAPPCDRMPALLYADPVDNVDHFGRRAPAHQAVDITDAIDTKERMLACHDSQRLWLRSQHGEDDYLAWMRRCGADRARDFGRPSVKYAEGYTRHLGHGFPKEDLLLRVLGPERIKTLAFPDAGPPGAAGEPR